MAEAKKGRGCFFYGCITLIILIIALVVGIFFAARYGLKYVRDQFTSPQPVAVAPITLQPAEGEKAMKRVEDFRRAMQGGQTSAPLELTGEELDYVVRNSREGSQLKDHAHLTITNDQIHAELSMPLGVFHPMLEGRYFNGDAQLSVGLRNGALAFDLNKATVNGQPVPSQALMNMKPMEWRPQPTDAGYPLITNLQRIEIKDGKIVLIPKGQ